jgi:hypothetical protein
VTIVNRLRHEFHLFRSAWQQIETFVDRIDEARDKDEEHAKKTRALLVVAAAIEQERRLRDGAGLDLPLEIAADDGSAELTQKIGESVGPKKKGKRPAQEWAQIHHGGAGKMAAGALGVLAELGTAKKRLPGAWDLEVAVGTITARVTTGGDLQDTTIVTLPGTLGLYQRFDEKQGELVQIVVPRYDAPLGSALTVDVKDENPSLFAYSQRESAARGDPENGPKKWTAFRDLRKDDAKIEGSVSDLLVAVLAGGDAKARAALADALEALAKAVSKRASDVSDAAQDESLAELDESLSSGVLAKVGADLAARAALYQRGANELRSPKKMPPAHLPNYLATLQQIKKHIDHDPAADLYAKTGSAAKKPGPLDAALDEEIDARIAYPDGTLRMLRVMEWALSRVWPMRKVWFRVRDDRYLRPLLVDRFLRGFAFGMWRAYLNLPTGAQIPGGLVVDPTRPAVLNNGYVQLAPPASGGMWDLGSVTPGQVAFVDGARRTLAVLLGDASITGRRDPQGPIETLQRLQITRLRVSTSKSAGRCDVPGMLVSDPAAGLYANLTAMPLADFPSDADFRAGTVKGRPQHDALVQEILALWSRLCLVLGTKKVRALASLPGLVPPGATPPAKIPSELPSDLPVDARVPLARDVSPHDRKLVVKLDDLRAALKIQGDAVPIVARPGELLLVRGPDANGALWQGVVEVVSLTRTTLDAVDAEPAAPLGNLVCCDPPGDVLVIQVLDTTFPQPLVAGGSGASALVIHRDFRGFGTLSLGTRVVLPADLDPSEETAGESPDVYRGLELDAACKIIDGWMYPPG